MNYPLLALWGHRIFAFLVVYYFFVVICRAIQRRRHDKESSVPPPPKRVRVDEDEVMGPPSPKRRSHNGCVKAEYFVGDSTLPLLTFDDVKDVTAYDDRTVVIVTGKKRSETILALAGTGYLICSGTPAFVLWQNLTRVQVFCGPTKVFDELIAHIDRDIFDGAGFVGYLEDGSDIKLVIGSDLTALLEKV